MAENLSVFKPRKLRNSYFFRFSYYNFEDTVTDFEKTCSAKDLLTYKQNFKHSVFSHFSFCCKVCSENQIK